MKLINCRLCGSKTHVDLFQKRINKGTYTIVRCSRCGLIYVNPQPSSEELRRFYERDFDYSYMLRYSYKDRQLNERRVRQISKYAQGGKLLDVGCGSGFFLNSAKKAFDVEGIDVSRRVADFAMDNFGLVVRVGDFLDAKLSKGYDVVTLFHVLEHLNNPNRYLRKIHGLLEEGGLLAGVVPNINSVRAKLNGKGWEWINPPKHLFYFSTGTLSRLLEQNGFEIIEMSTSRGGVHNPILSYALGLIQRFGLWDTFASQVTGNKNAAAGLGAYKLVDTLTSILSLPLVPVEYMVDRLGYGPELTFFARKLA